jgi:hypothetical protein
LSNGEGCEEDDSQYEDIENTTNEEDNEEQLDGEHHDNDQDELAVKKTSHEQKHCHQNNRRPPNNGKPVTLHNLKSLKLSSLFNQSKQFHMRPGLNGNASGRVVKNGNGKRLYIKHEKLEKLFKNGGLEMLEQNNKNAVELINESLANSMRDKFASIAAPLFINNNDVSSCDGGNRNASHEAFVLSKKKAVKKLGTASQERSQQISVANNFTDSVNMLTSDPEMERAPAPLNRKYLIRSVTTSGDAAYGSDNVFKCRNCKFLFLDVRLLNEHAQTCQIDYNAQSGSYSSNLVHEYANGHSDSGDRTATRYVDSHSVFCCSFCQQRYPNKLSFVLHAVVCVNALELIQINPSATLRA